MIGWIVAAVAILAVWYIPLGLAAVYDTRGVAARLKIGPVFVQLYPKKKNAENTAKKQRKQHTPDNFEKVKKEEIDGGSYSDFLPIVKRVLDLLLKLKRKLIVKRLELQLVLAADDPADLGINYGRAWAILGNLMPQMERVFVIKKRMLDVACDFISEETLIRARIDLSIHFGKLLCIACVHGIGILKEYFSLLKLRKGGSKL